jgi:hypothetical protein
MDRPGNLGEISSSQSRTSVDKAESSAGVQERVAPNGPPRRLLGARARRECAGANG